MAPLRRFLNLPPVERRLWCEAVLLLGAVRVGLWLLPYGVLRRLLTRTRPAVRKSGQDEVTWAVRSASRYVPACTCLVQALSGEMLLTRHGYLARLHIGVAKEEGGELQAHAWVESDGQVVLGGAVELGRYQRLESASGERP